LRPVECLAACERAPAIQINEKLIGPVDPADVPRLLAEYRR
jgi:NADH:ubiquinone oxidoreductase subunit E